MEPETIQAIAGFTSTAIFASSKVPMLLKAFLTKDLKSYSLGHIALSNTGNLIYWLYIISLPLGPVWFLQGFFTLADVLMLLCLVKSMKSGNSDRIRISEPTLAASPSNASSINHDKANRHLGAEAILTLHRSLARNQSLESGRLSATRLH